MTEEQKNNKENEVLENEEELNEPKIEHYELLYIVSNSYTADELKPINEKISSLIKEQGGKITKEESLGKNKLAYPIKQLSHGYYQLYEFDLVKENLLNLNTALKLNKELVRFLIVKKKVKTEAALREEKALQEKLAKKKEKEIEKIKKGKEEDKEKPKKEKGKVSLEDLDKKLDEILGGDEML